MNVLLVRLLGGEPLLREDACDIIEQLHSFKFSKMFTTNGSLMTLPVAKALHGSGFCLVNVSLDGPESIHDAHSGVPGSYAKVIHAIECLKQSGLRVAVISVLNKMNVAAIVETLRIVNEMGVGIFKIIPLVRIGRARENAQLQLSYEQWCEFYLWLTEQKVAKKSGFEKIQLVFCNCNYCTWEMYYPLPAESRKRLLKEAWGIDLDVSVRSPGGLHCVSGIDRLVIMANGDIYPCEEMFHVEHMKAGNLRDNSLADIWHRSARLRKLRGFTQNDIIGPCADCDNPYCSGTNLGEAYLETGTISGSDLRCPEAKVNNHEVR